jgi:hypothetical protein
MDHKLKILQNSLFQSSVVVLKLSHNLRFGTVGFPLTLTSMNAPQRKVKSAPKPLHHTPIDWFRVLQIIRLNLDY